MEKRPAAGELRKHKRELGDRYVLVDKNNYEKANLYAIVMVLRNVSEEYEPAEPRRHSVDAAMFFLGSGEDLKGLRAEVRINDKKFIVESPASVYIPAGTLHSYKIIRGSGMYIKVVLAPGGDYNAITY